MNWAIKITPPVPFFIFYKIEEKLGLIIILAVLHASRDPKVWKGRA